MKTSTLRLLGFWVIVLALTAGTKLSAAPPDATVQNRPPDFDREVRPILAENCFACHGFDTNRRQAGLRLDTPEGAYSKLTSGGCAIVPGKPAAGELMARITTDGPLHMPPVGSGKKLTAAQVALLRRWVATGAKYAAHWAFVPPVRPALPPVKNALWPHNPIDRFILARLEREGLKPSPEADRATLLRRVTFDLTGLPPTLAETDRFLADRRPDAYERVVDRLLASPHYGERMALAWLDLARYADTHGFHIDSQRDMWRWREWVIDAYNRNLPYDQFTLLQLAGDLLPHATQEQRLATGFNRNHPINFEGGAIPEEYQTAYIVDRIDTTATAFMGLTMRCAQCHDHKYDPIRQQDYYRFYAYFNSIAEQGLDGQKGNAMPYMPAPSPEQERQLAEFTVQQADLNTAMKRRAGETSAAVTAWAQQATTDPEKAAPAIAGLTARWPLDETQGDLIHDTAGKVPPGKVFGKPLWTQGKWNGAFQFDGNTHIELDKSLTYERTDKFSYGAWVYPTAADADTVISRMDDAAKIRGWDLYLGLGKVSMHLIHEWPNDAIRVNTKDNIALNKWHHLFVTYDGSSKAAGVHLYVDGKLAELVVTQDSLTGSIVADKPLTIGRRTPAGPFHGMIQDVRIYGRELASTEVADMAEFTNVRPLLSIPVAKRTPDQTAMLAGYYLRNRDADYRKLSDAAADLSRKRAALESAIPTSMVMQELDKPRDTFMLIRGQYDQHGAKVSPGTPEFLPPLPKDAPPNRLALARWLIDPSHPLTARVAVNRTWQMLFGTGIVKTAEDFGTQGERPSHPELLDWLATEFVGTGWDVKGVVRLMVTSAAYRQSSQQTPAQRERDPENRLLARGPRVRLQAEFIRDQALSLAGLLVDKIGGPSVKPYQPAGLWEELAFGGDFSAQSYQQDHGEALYRRTMYTFWKRTCPPPSLQTLDAPEREFCIVRRSVTNTPLQALILMNDPTYVEAARKFAERIMASGRITPQARIAYAFRMATARSPRGSEQTVLLEIYKEQLAVFQRDPKAAEKLLAVGESKRDTMLDTCELAAWSVVASALLNLDETITKS
jgi:hypothetical protein